MPYLENTENFISQVTLIGYGFGSIVECLSNTHAALGSISTLGREEEETRHQHFQKTCFKKKTGIQFCAFY